MSDLKKPENDTKKIENIILFICNNSRGWMTEPRLSLLMWRIDKAAFLMLARKITNMQYDRKQIGPVPVGLASFLAAMEAEGSIRYIVDKRIQATRKTDRSCFSKGELRVMDTVIAKYGLLDTKKLISIAHDLAWATYADGEEIPFEAYLSKIENPPASTQDAIRARICEAEAEYEKAGQEAKM